jgi:hypothetical protein
MALMQPNTAEGIAAALAEHGVAQGPQKLLQKEQEAAEAAVLCVRAQALHSRHPRASLRVHRDGCRLRGGQREFSQRVCALHARAHISFTRASALQMASGIYTVFRCETSREHPDFCTRVAPSALYVSPSLACI